jgi:D-alanyl-D-alanine carboxypeptidase/D-alanyl-D-alanine-endopeptidase (penicillin-binding protein 4)
MTSGTDHRAALLGLVLPVVACMAPVPALAVDRGLGADVPKPAASGSPWTQAEVGSLAASLDAMLAGAKAVRGAHVGIYAVDARDGRALYARNADDAFQPASTLKLVVGSAALDTLGPDWRARTTLTANGPVDAQGRLNGALVLRGGGDPLLRASDLAAAADAVSAAGITRVAGPFVIDDSRFDQQRYGNGWAVDDLPYSYAPVVAATTLEDGVLHLTVTPGAAAGAPAVLSWDPPAGADAQAPPVCPPASDDAHIVDAVTTGAAGAADTVDVERGPCGVIRVSGTIPLGSAPDRIDAAVPSPERYVQRVFAAALEAHGIGLTVSVDRPLHGAPVVTAPYPRDGERVLWSHDSEPLRDLLADLWLPSDNLLAESLLKQLAVAGSGAPGSDPNGTAFELSWLKGLGVDAGTLALEDGSGLSAYDRVTPRDLVTVLVHDWNGPYRELVLDDLPIAGVRGTLASSYAGTAAEKRVFAKTGSLSHVSTLAGYVATRAHGTVIIAFQVDDWIGAPAALRELRGRMLSRIVEE